MRVALLGALALALALAAAPARAADSNAAANAVFHNYIIPNDVDGQPVSVEEALAGGAGKCGAQHRPPASLPAGAAWRARRRERHPLKRPPSRPFPCLGRAARPPLRTYDTAPCAVATCDAPPRRAERAAHAANQTLLALGAPLVPSRGRSGRRLASAPSRRARSGHLRLPALRLGLEKGHGTQPPAVGCPRRRHSCSPVGRAVLCVFGGCACRAPSAWARATPPFCLLHDPAVCRAGGKEEASG